MKTDVIANQGLTVKVYAGDEIRRINLLSSEIDNLKSFEKRLTERLGL